MCCCGTPVINGQMGYKWQPNDAPSVRPVDAPALGEQDVLLYDEPGRCGGLDAHCHHYRLVRRLSSVYLLVRHGGGDERCRVSHTKSLMGMLDTLDSNARYWLFHAIYYAYSDGAQNAREETIQRWRKAAAEKRIKTRKQRGSNQVKVWIVD